MSENERTELSQRWKDGLKLAEYRMIREKARRGETLILSNHNGGTHEVPAKELLKELYDEEI